MLRKISIALGMAFIALSLAACEPPLEEGKIVDKTYEPAREWTSTTFINISCGQYCSFPVPITNHHYDDEDWVITIQDKREDGSNRQRRVFISEEKFETVAVGDWFSLKTEKETVSTYDPLKTVKVKE